MNQRELLDVLRRATRAERWTEWVGGIEPVVRRLQQANDEKNERELDETGTAILEIVYKRGVRNQEPAVVGVAAEIFGLCQLEKLFHMGREHYFAAHDPIVGEPHQQIRRVFLGSLVTIAAGPKSFGVFKRVERVLLPSFGDLIGHLREKADKDDRQYLEDCLKHSRDLLHVTGAPEDDGTLAGSHVEPPPSGGYPGAPNLLPGDCLFRELRGAGGIFPQAVRDLGHTGIYVGLPAPDANPGDLRNHQVVEMTLQGGCQITTVDQFKKPVGFWGYYSISLDPRRRGLITALARSYVGRCHYGVSITGYKNPVALSFRCDGFVEHCHESLQAGAPLPAHKWGLFEDDKWNTLTPAALRNCFFLKYP